MTSAELAPLLIDEATKKSGLVWVGTPAAVSPVWLLWHEGSAYVLTGPGEQSADGLAEGAPTTVTVRSKDKGGRLVTWEAGRHRADARTPRTGTRSCRCSWASGSTWSTARPPPPAGRARPRSTG